MFTDVTPALNWTAQTPRGRHPEPLLRVDENEILHKGPKHGDPNVTSKITLI